MADAVLYGPSSALCTVDLKDWRCETSGSVDLCSATPGKVYASKETFPPLQTPFRPQPFMSNGISLSA